MKFKYTFLILCLGGFVWGWSQSEEANNLIVDGNEYHGEEDYIEAEAQYRKAYSLASNRTEALHNLGNTNYRIQDFDAASQRFFQTQKNTTNKEIKHAAFHNMGNAYMKRKEYPKAVEAFKNALKNNPTDEETRYNYALAKELLKKDEENKDNENKDKDNKDNKDNKEGDNKDKDNKEGDNKDSEGGDDDEKKDDGKDGEDKKDDEKKPKDPKEKEDEKGKGDKKEQPPKPRKPGQLSPEQVKSLLKAMNNQEKGVQEKVNAEKVKGTPVKTKKDW